MARAGVKLRANTLSRRDRQAGFTLIEAVVSLMLLAVMSVMSYQAVEVILGANERSRGQLEDESQLHRAWQVMSRDIMHLRSRGLGDVYKRQSLTPATSACALVAVVDPWCARTRRASAASNTD